MIKCCDSVEVNIVVIQFIYRTFTFHIELDEIVCENKFGIAYEMVILVEGESILEPKVNHLVFSIQLCSHAIFFIIYHFYCDLYVFLYLNRFLNQKNDSSMIKCRQMSKKTNFQSYFPVLDL